MEAIETIYRTEAPAIRATLIRLLGSFDLAEDALQMGFAAAALAWPRDGVPRNPRAWLISAGRFRLIDDLRRRARLAELEPEIIRIIEEGAEHVEVSSELADDMLRLIFICCHPAISADAHVALCLREVCGLTTEAIAAAYFSTPGAMAQRIVRAKQKIRQARLPYEVPEGDELEPRLESVLRVVYLIFSEGYAPASADTALRTDLAEEAIRLARLLGRLLPAPDIDGLLGLMLLQHSRRAARFDPTGRFVPLSEQDRSLWDRPMIQEGMALVQAAFAHPPLSSATLQAGIARIHAQALFTGHIDWAGIVALYDLLVIADPGPAVDLNRAIAIGMRDGPEAGLALIDALAVQAPDGQARFLAFARADFLSRIDPLEALRAYAAISALPLGVAERLHIAHRLEELGH
jgi:RNA polymerase sigma-70 factor (ECF subfamily)